MSNPTDIAPSVLIVDDDRDALELSRHLVLRAAPAATVCIACSVEAAKTHLLGLEAAPAAPPSIVLLDLYLRESDGCEVLSWIRERPMLAHIKVVMLTTSDDPKDLKRCTDLGAHAYLIKYPNHAVMACILHEACSRSQSQQVPPKPAVT